LTTWADVWRSWKYDDWLVKWKSTLAGGFSIIVAFVLVLLVRTLAFGEWLHITVSDIFTGLLAAGTLALAYAALVQAVSAEKKRRSDLVPHLDLRILEEQAEEDKDLIEATAVNPFELESEREKMHLSVRNLGPGNAMRVEVTAYFWWTDPFARGGEPENLIANPPPGVAPLQSRTETYRRIVNVPFSLKANEEYKFDPDIWSTSVWNSQAGPMGSMHRFVRQAIVLASVRDVEGTPASGCQLGITLQALSPKTRAMGPTVMGFGYRTRWKWLTDVEIKSIPRLSVNPTL
jgi:hypothetical protein